MVTAIILAGGRGRRMGYQEKGLMLLQGRPLCQHVIDRLAPQVSSIIMNANQNITRYQQFNYPVVSDQWNDFQGPLAGVHAGLRHSTDDWHVVASCDTPYLPDDLVARLQQASAGKRAAYAVVGETAHPISMWIHRRERPLLEDFLRRGQRKPLDFLKNVLKAVAVDFSDQPNAFLNINDPIELERQEQRR